MVWKSELMNGPCSTRAARGEAPWQHDDSDEDDEDDDRDALGF